MTRRYVGIDLAKRKMDVCILEGKKIVRHTLKTDDEGRERLRKLLRKSDVVGMEMCCCSTMLTREIERNVGCKVYQLNAGDLQIIWRSIKKTDKEDALKIAKYIRDTPEDSMKIVAAPSVEEEAARSDLSMDEFLKKERTAAINRLHSLYARVGIIDVEKADLADEEGRKARRGELPAELQEYAKLLEEQLVLFDKQLADMDEKVNERARGNELTPRLMSIPGVGIKLAAVIEAYLGDGSRFSKASQVANYAGLAPIVDCSGTSDRYGSLPKWTYCRPIRSMIMEGVWAMTRSKDGGNLRSTYEKLSGRIGKKKSAVAIGRKMIKLGWLLMRRGEVYNGIDIDAFKRKMKYYKVKSEIWEPLIDEKAKKVSEKNQAEKIAEKLVKSAKAA